MRRRLHWYAEGLHEDDTPSGGILFLPGRGGHGVQMMRKYLEIFNFPGIALMSLSPIPPEYGWYPMPNGPQDQSHSVQGLRLAVEAVENVLTQIEDTYKLGRDKIILSGFSAGAVVAIHHHTTTKKPCAGVISHGGAILEPNRLKKAQHKRPIVLNHSEDDFCFDWYERYLPMKEALLAKGYKVWLAERKRGNHTLLWNDIERCHNFFEKVLDTKLAYPEWTNLVSDPDDPDDPDTDDYSALPDVTDPAAYDEWIND